MLVRKMDSFASTYVRRRELTNEGRFQPLTARVGHLLNQH